MRVWLVDDKNGGTGGNLELLLRRLEEQPGTGLQFIGCSAFQPDFGATLRKWVPDPLDVLLVNEPAWPEEAAPQEVFSPGLSMVVVAAADRIERFRALATRHPIVFVPPPSGAEELWLALVTAFLGQRRESYFQAQLDRLQQRLNDRIVVERAKGILVQHLRISEDDAYKRLRMLSRRQRRQIREIAQSLLDAQCLFAPGSNGYSELMAETPQPEPENRASAS